MATVGQVARGGIRSKGIITIWPTGETAPMAATDGTDTTPVVTETYIARVAVLANATLTGVSIVNGSAVAGNVVVILYDDNGTVIANSALAGTAQAGTAAYQDIPFTAPVDIQGPGRYFVGVQFSSTSARFRSHTFGRFPAFKKTGETFGTPTTITPVSTFTTNTGPIASVY